MTQFWNMAECTHKSNTSLSAKKKKEKHAFFKVEKKKNFHFLACQQPAIESHFEQSSTSSL